MRLYIPTYLRAIVLAVALALAGCSTADPLKTAQTLEQKAFALYGTFVVYEEAGAEMILDPAVPDSVKVVIQQADSVAKPAADILVTVARETSVARAELALIPSETFRDKLVAAIAALQRAYWSAKPKIDALSLAVENL